jgi:NAD(P)-dependent dehydrogenase (short-subunit alcohol dehydrogenase family)
MINKDNKAIFITGSSSGLGRATAKLFASKGWKVIASMRDPKKEKELGNIAGVTLTALDVTDPREIESVAEQVMASGGVDVVFNNAGYGLAGPLEGLTNEQVLRMVNTNMLRAIRTTKTFIPHFREKSRIVHQYDVDWRTPDGSFQLHLSRDEMGAGRLGRKHGL